MVFPRGGDVPRHPSQLYEAFFEGIVLFTVLYLLARRPNIRRTPGALFGALLIGYGLCRIGIEYVREPDQQIGLLYQYFTMGQLLSLPMIMAGMAVIVYGRKHQTVPAR
jgi:phosphatidylglycerol:prolipoprotein diacylglycerol transferase